jgi:hypothetical protein
MSISMTRRCTSEDWNVCCGNECGVVAVNAGEPQAERISPEITAVPINPILQQNCLDFTRNVPLHSAIKDELNDRPIRRSSVGAGGFEPPTPCTPCRCASGLRYAPMCRHYSPSMNQRQGNQPVAPKRTNTRAVWRTPAMKFSMTKFSLGA